MDYNGCTFGSLWTGSPVSSIMLNIMKILNPTLIPLMPKNTFPRNWLTDIYFIIEKQTLSVQAVLPLLSINYCFVLYNGKKDEKRAILIANKFAWVDKQAVFFIWSCTNNNTKVLLTFFATSIDFDSRIVFICSTAPYHVFTIVLRRIVVFSINSSRNWIPFAFNYFYINLDAVKLWCDSLRKK